MKKRYLIKEIFTCSRRLKHFITTPIFYVNGPPHIGHLYTALLADTSHRWQLLKAAGIAGDLHDSDCSLFTSGADEHGLKIQQAARNAGFDPKNYCDQMSNQFKDLMRDFYIEPSDFIRTTETRHKEVVARVWKELIKRGDIKMGKYEGWYSTTDECFYTNDEVEKLEGNNSMVSKTTGSTVEWVQEENYVFPLSKYIGAVRNWLNSNDIIRPKLYLPEALRQADTEGNLSLSRNRKRVNWGITVPGDESQTIYVWFDALMNYLTVSGIYSNKKLTIWPPTCQIIGKDILKIKIFSSLCLERFHAVIWPAFLLALDLPLPKRIFVHSHWLVDGVKMSKSVGNVVDPFVTAKSLTTEGLRYFLLRQGTPQNDANFIMLKAINVINTDLVNTVGNLLQRALVEKLIPDQKYPTFYMDSFRNDLLELGEPLVESMDHLPKLYSEQLDDLMVYKALELLIEVVRLANGFFQFYEPWKEFDEKKVSSLLYICCEALRISGILLQPVVPHYADRLLNRLGINKNERGLNDAKFMTDPKYSGRPLGEYDGPIMARIAWKIDDKMKDVKEHPMSDEKPKKRSKKASPSHECTVILVDVGANMKMMRNEIMDMQSAKDTVEWIITRKIFTESVDEFTLVLFGSEKTQNSITDDENIYFYEEEMQKAKIDWLRFIDKEIKPSESVNGDFLAGLIVSLEYMRNHLESYPESNITARNILLVTNLGGTEDNLDTERIEAVVNGMKALEINFNVIGPSILSLDEFKEKFLESEKLTGNLKKNLKKSVKSLKMEQAENVLADIAKRTNGVIYSFSEALPMLQRFIPRKLALRGQKFYLELGLDFKLPLQLYKKIQPADFKLSMGKYALTSDTHVKRKTVYEKYEKEDVSDDANRTDTDADAEGSDTNASRRRGPKILEKGEVIKGFKFGSTIVPYNEEDEKEYGWKSESRGLKLLQFTKRSEILEHYLMDGGTYYCIPPAADEEACVALSALINAMIAEDVVALTRFVYNAASHPRIMALFPRKSKKGAVIFVGIQLPFYEDFRGYNFPSLNDPANEPKRDHLSAVHELVKAMDLTKAHFNPETQQFEEALRPRDVPNPKLQNVCKALKHRALHPNTPLPVFEKKLLGDLLEPNAALLKRASESLTYLKKHFPLLESPTKKQRGVEVKEELLPSMPADKSALPASGRFITTDELDA